MSIQDPDQRFRAEITALHAPASPLPEQNLPPGFTGRDFVELFEAQVLSRQADLAARRLGANGRGFYSIGSSGHEGNVALAAASRVTDPVLPHYRSGAFFVHRARRAGVADPVRDILLGVVAAAADPISGGRHKVFGSAVANIIPQTSTIASQLPRAVGLAFALERADRLGVACPWPSDAVVLCSFGDASANHSTATGAINAAVHTAHLGVPLPVLFVCEDNGIGISVPTPPDWIEHAYGHRPGLRWFAADGCVLSDAVERAVAAVDWVRAQRRPAFLHLRTVRLFGHAGSDVENAYRDPAAIEAGLARDPVTATARDLITAGICTPRELLDRYDRLAEQVVATAYEVCAEPKLATAEAVSAPLAADRANLARDDLPHLDSRAQKSAESSPAPPPAAKPRARRDDRPPGPVHRIGRVVEIEGDLATEAPAGAAAAPEAPAQTLAQAINRTLADLLARDPHVLVFGEDVARKGGVYGVTRGLRKRFGPRRVFDTLLDEQSILGTALGAGLAGFVPIPEIQYLAYVHNALDQLRGEAATLSFFSAGRYRNPMVVRIAGYAYQRGFGGHFHNDNSVAALRDIPGVIVASPARPDDAAAALRTCVAAARADGRVCLFLEPIALYHTRDLYEPDDGQWAAAGSETVSAPIGRARVYGAGTDLTIVAFANTVPMSLRVARRLARRGIGARVLDLRWLAPLPHADLIQHAEATGRVLVADETRRSGGVSESVCATLVDAGFTGTLTRVTSADCFVPLGPAAATVLLSEADIEAAADRSLSPGRA
ncbi:transketolase C-terminal domain-containing protein [Nocardia sienata]|uniref:transketolase C-terminal domain-containing protein n=1 Tax=Nocardia sienata TaxID=248552 RepID=UPI0007A4A9D3|nr:transketolase C-terminal domain-containing protein [Nocardia sienata]